MYLLVGGLMITPTVKIATHFFRLSDVVTGFSMGVGIGVLLLALTKDEAWLLNRHILETIVCSNGDVVYLLCLKGNPYHCKFHYYRSIEASL